VDPVLARYLAAEVERCRLPRSLAPTAPITPNPLAADPGLDPVGVAEPPVEGPVLALAPLSQEEDVDGDEDDEDDNSNNNNADDEDDNNNNNNADDEDENNNNNNADDEDDEDYDKYENRVVKVTGILLREEVFEVLQEVVDDLAGQGLDDDLEDIKTSLTDLRVVCGVRDLLTTIKALRVICASSEHRRMLKVV
jgi:hypothetical protein